MKVLLFTKYEKLGASSRVRCLQYLEYLERLNVKVDVRSLITDEMLIEKFKFKKKYSIFKLLSQFVERINQTKNLDQYDVVWIQKEFLPNVPFFIEYLFLKRAKAVILDLDDAEFLKYSKGVRKLFLHNKYSLMAKKNDLTVVGNEYLNQKILDWGGASKIIPSVIDFVEYENIDQLTLKDEVFVIGWIGSPSTQKYIDMILPIVERFSDSVDTTVELHLVGASLEMQKKSKLVKVFEWKKETEVSLLSQFDVGVMPLIPSEWEKGKCSFKAIQCMAASKPVIVSSTQANCDLVENNVNGFVANTEDDWYEALLTLFNGFEMRMDMGKLNRIKIKNHFSVESQTPSLLEAFESVTGNDSK